MSGEVRIVVLTVEGHPSFMVSCPNFGQPRAAFVDQVVRRLYGRQPGSAHEWKMIEEEEPARVDVPAVDNPKVDDWLLEKPPALPGWV